MRSGNGYAWKQGSMYGPILVVLIWKMIWNTCILGHIHVYPIFRQTHMPRVPFRPTEMDKTRGLPGMFWHDLRLLLGWGSNSQKVEQTWSTPQTWEFNADKWGFKGESLVSLTNKGCDFYQQPSIMDIKQLMFFAWHILSLRLCDKMRQHGNLQYSLNYLGIVLQ